MLLLVQDLLFKMMKISTKPYKFIGIFKKIAPAALIYSTYPLLDISATFLQGFGPSPRLKGQSHFPLPILARIPWYFWKKHEADINISYFFVKKDIHLQSNFCGRSWYLVLHFFVKSWFGLVLAHHFLWINCEILNFLWILEIS